MVKDTTRGATLEVVVSRMKAVHAYRTAQNPDTGLSMRFVAASATIPNVSDVSSRREHHYVILGAMFLAKSIGFPQAIQTLFPAVVR